MMIFWFYFLVFLLEECILKVLNTSIIKELMMLMCGPALFLCTNSGAMLFMQYPSCGNRKGEIWSELGCPLPLSLVPLPLSVRRIEQKRAALLLGSLACGGGGWYKIHDIRGLKMYTTKMVWAHVDVLPDCVTVSLSLPWFCLFYLGIEANRLPGGDNGRFRITASKKYSELLSLESLLRRDHWLLRSAFLLSSALAEFTVCSL